MTKNFSPSPLGVALFACALGLFAGSAAHAGPKKHSKVEITADKTCDNKTKTKNVKVKVVPDNGLVVNTDGPWKLMAKNPKGLKLAKTSWTKADFDSKMPGFTMAVSCDGSAGASFDYQLMAFVCTKDKKLCYFDRHEGKHSI